MDFLKIDSRPYDLRRPGERPAETLDRRLSAIAVTAEAAAVALGVVEENPETKVC